MRQELKPPLFADMFLVSLAVALVGFSLVMVYSTTAIVSQEKFLDPFFYTKRQTISAVVGLVFLVLLSRADVEWMRRLSPFLLFVSLGLLLLPLLPGLGESSGGAKRWINLFGLRFQPGEFAKLSFIVYLAGYFERHERDLENFVAGIFKPLLFVGFMGALFLMQPDFGSTAIVALITISMCALCGARLRYLIIGGVCAVLVLGISVAISPYRLGRMFAFLSPWADSSGKGYQLIQSLIAVGTGQFGGLGLGESKQKLFFLPAAHTDFIFAVVAEELGFVGGVLLIAAFLLILWRGFKLAARVVEDSFSFALVIGCTMLVVLPAVLNVGVVIGLLPTKGLVLPLVGYGGSSLIASLMSVGLLLAVGRRSYLGR